ncbi:MAG: ATP-binding cassette domain-containing protein [Rhodobacteraceae bacterium]|nr:ATP-binding cassette domain-containing protein [Paracoccaceae bacterium]
MLTLEGVRLTRGDWTLSADLTVQAGSRVAVIGPSGAGKSTLLDLISGFVEPTGGRILWDDTLLTGQAPGARPISLLFQDGNLFPHLSAFQNIALGLRPSLRLTPAERDRVRASLSRVGLSGMEDRKPGALSGGQRSRVALARMLLRAEPLVLLDEPFAALGPALKDEMLALLLDLIAEIGATLLMVTHDPEDARALKGQTILVADGVAHPPEDTGALFSNPPAALAAYLG